MKSLDETLNDSSQSRRDIAASMNLLWEPRNLASLKMNPRSSF